VEVDERARLLGERESSASARGRSHSSRPRSFNSISSLPESWRSGRLGSLGGASSIASTLNSEELEELQKLVIAEYEEILQQENFYNYDHENSLEFPAQIFMAATFFGAFGVFWVMYGTMVNELLTSFLFGLSAMLFILAYYHIRTIKSRSNNKVTPSSTPTKSHFPY